MTRVVRVSRSLKSDLSQRKELGDAADISDAKSVQALCKDLARFGVLSVVLPCMIIAHALNEARMDWIAPIVNRDRLILGPLDRKQIFRDAAHSERASEPDSNP